MKLDQSAVQTFVGLLAFFISIVALFFSWQQVEISRKHNRLSVVPILNVTPFAEGSLAATEFTFQTLVSDPQSSKNSQLSQGTS